MTALLFRGLALLLVGALLAVLVGKQAPDMGLLVTLACGSAVLMLSVRFLEPIVDLIMELRDLGSVDTELSRMLLRTVGVGILAEIAASICEDAGQGSMGKLSRFLGSLGAVYLSLPALERVLELIRELLTGSAF